MASDMAAQYVHDATGTYIPATQRPDGTWRKARRVKDGYIPQDEMPLYESKGKQWAKNKPSLPVGLDPKYALKDKFCDIDVPKSIPGLGPVETASKPSKKKKKKKTDAAKDQDIVNDVQKLNISPNLPNDSCENDMKKPQATEPLKRLRNLRKKLKEINALLAKIETGELPNPEKDQLEKVARKAEIESEMEELMLEMSD